MNIKPKPSPAIDSLKAYPNWVCWKLHNGAKVPVNPNNGNFAKSSDSSTWGTYEQAKQRFKGGGMEGLGFMFDDKAGIVGVDLDNKPDRVFDENGELREWARDIVSSLNSYTELSPSGNGLHILCIGTIPSSLGSSAEHGVEMYANKRFFTMTGRHLPFTPDTVNDSQAALTQLHGKYKPHHKRTSSSVATSSAVGNNAYGTKALQSAVSIVTGTRDGARNNTLFNETCSILKLANGGSLGIMEAKQALINAGINAGLSEHEAQRTVESASRTVGNDTRYPPEKEAKPQDTITITVEELEKIKDKEYWRGYHDGMTAAQLQTWLNLGVPEYMVNEWGLGYNESIVDKTTGEFLGEGVSIPIFNKGGELQNIEYRTTEGKIHYEVNRPALFNPEKKLTGTIIIIPDNIDTMTAWTKAGHIEIGGERVTFLGLPLCKIDEQAINELSEAEHIYVMLGNDTKTDGRGMGVLKNKARFTRLPCTVSQAMAKIDDVKMKRILSSAQI